LLKGGNMEYGVLRFFDGETIGTDWVHYDFGGFAGNIRIYNDSSKAIEISFDGGATIHGKVLAGEIIVWERRYEKEIWLRGEEAGSAKRLEAW